MTFHYHYTINGEPGSVTAFDIGGAYAYVSERADEYSGETGRVTVELSIRRETSQFRYVEVREYDDAKSRLRGDKELDQEEVRRSLASARINARLRTISDVRIPEGKMRYAMEAIDSELADYVANATARLRKENKELRDMLVMFSEEVRELVDDARAKEESRKVAVSKRVSATRRGDDTVRG